MMRAVYKVTSSFFVCNWVAVQLNRKEWVMVCHEMPRKELVEC